MGSTPGRGQGGVLGAVPIEGRCPGVFFGFFGRRVFCDRYPTGRGFFPSWLVLALVLSWSGAVWAFFWPFLAFCWLWLLWVIGAAAPILALASLAFSPGSGRGICFSAFAPVLASCPFVLGRAVGPGPPRAFWPLRRPWLFALLSWAVRSGMALWWAFCGCCYNGGWVALCFVWLRCSLGVWVVVAPVVTSRDAILFGSHCRCFVGNRAPLSSLL